MVIFFLTECNSKSDIIFIIDQSAFIGRYLLKRAKSFVIELIEQFNRGQSYIGLINYDSNANLLLSLSNNPLIKLKEALRDNVSFVGGYPYTVGAISLAIDEFSKETIDRKDIANFAFILTGGTRMDKFDMKTKSKYINFYLIKSNKRIKFKYLFSLLQILFFLHFYSTLVYFQLEL